MGKNKSNIYCESCKKFHKKGMCSKKIVKPLVKGELESIMRLIGKATHNIYFSRDLLSDAEELKDSDIVKEVNEDDSKKNI